MSRRVAGPLFTIVLVMVLVVLSWSRVVIRARQPPPEPSFHIVIDVDSRRLTLYRDGARYKSYPIAVGKDGWPSPVGEWRIIHKDRDWGGGFGTRWLGLDVPWGIYGIHGTNKDWSIGRAESHGCIRMFNRDVEELWDMVPKGTPVTIRGPWSVPHWQSGSPPFRPGDKTQPVAFLQLLLRSEGFFQGVANGRYDENVTESVKRLERFYGLPPDGVVGEDVMFLLSGRQGF